MAVRDCSTGQSLFVALDKLEEQVTCFVCKEQFTDPRTLPCLHSFCLECIKQLLVNLRGSADENLIKCPMCSKLVVLSGNPLGASLPLAHHLTSLIDVKQDFFLPLTYELSSSLCTIHREEMKLYCLTCSVGVCLECTVGDHTHHELRRLRLSELYLPEDGEEDGWIKVSRPGLLSSLIGQSQPDQPLGNSNSRASITTRGSTPTSTSRIDEGSLESHERLNREKKNPNIRATTTRGATPTRTNRIDEGSLESHERLNKEKTEQVHPQVPETEPPGPPSRNRRIISGLPTFQQYTRGESSRNISHSESTSGVSHAYSTIIPPTQQPTTGTTHNDSTTDTTTDRAAGTTTGRAAGTTTGGVTGMTTGTTTGRVTNTTTGRAAGTTTGRATGTTTSRVTGTTNDNDGIFQVILKEYELVRT